MEKVRLEDLCKPSTGQIKEKQDTLIDYIDISSICNVTKKVTGFQTIAFRDAPSRARKPVKKGNILVSTVRPNLNAVAILEKDTPNVSVASTGFCVLESKNGVEPRFIYYFCISKSFIDDMVSQATGASYPAVNDKIVRSSLIPLYTYEEQKNISDILDRASVMIDNYRAELLKLDVLVKARFVEMFGDINLNNKKWQQQPLGELCTIVRGGSPRPIEVFLNGDIPWIKISDATAGDNIYLNSTKEHIIQDGVKKSRLIKAGSLIFANCGVSLGFARIITFDGCIHDGWLAMENIDTRIDKVFLLYSLNQMTRYFREIAPEGTQPNLNTAIMKAYKQIIPPKDLQKEYVAFAKRVDTLKSEVQKSLDKTQQLFDGLMQEYFG